MCSHILWGEKVLNTVFFIHDIFDIMKTAIMHTLINQAEPLTRAAGVWVRLVSIDMKCIKCFYYIMYFCCRLPNPSMRECTVCADTRCQICHMPTRCTFPYLCWNILLFTLKAELTVRCIHSQDSNTKKSKLLHNCADLESKSTLKYIVQKCITPKVFFMWLIQNVSDCQQR